MEGGEGFHVVAVGEAESYILVECRSWEVGSEEW